MLRSHQLYKRLKFLFFALLTIVWVTACNGNPSNTVSVAPGSRIISHSMGETAVPENPQRIVALEPFTLESLLAMGIKPVGAPLDGLDDSLQDKVENVINIGNPPNLESVVALKPDLIFGTQYANQEIYSQSSSIAPTILFEFTGSGDWKNIVASIGNAINENSVSDQVLDNYNNRIETLKTEMGDRLSQTQVSLIRVYPDSISLYQKGSFAGSILEDAGLSRPPTQQGEDVQLKISKERILDADGDVMFLWTYANNAEREKEAQSALQELESDPLWSRLNVVQKGQVYEVGEHWLGKSAIAANLVLDDLFNYLVAKNNNS